MYFIALRERAAVEGIKPTTEKTHRGNPIKRAKWHLGIRSQSKPQDIMNEVYRAMKTLNFVRYIFVKSKENYGYLATDILLKVPNVFMYFGITSSKSVVLFNQKPDPTR